MPRKLCSTSSLQELNGKMCMRRRWVYKFSFIFLSCYSNVSIYTIYFHKGKRCQNLLKIQICSQNCSFLLLELNEVAAPLMILSLSCSGTGSDISSPRGSVWMLSCIGCLPGNFADCHQEDNCWTVLICLRVCSASTAGPTV